MKKHKKRTQVDYMYRVSIRPSYSVAYLTRADGLPPSRTQKFKPLNQKPMGLISKKAATRMTNAVNWMVLFSHKKRVYSKKTKKSYTFLINFITLTLSEKQKHSDEYIKRHMLYPFLRWMGRAHRAKLYVWKAETQANGNIHFHITANTYIGWKSIRAKWNSIQQKNGYMKKWTEGNIPADPNSTDVHAVLKVDQLAKYMVKYMVKNDETRRKITGHVWGCSPELTQMTIYIDEHDSQFAEACNIHFRQSEKKTLDHATLFLHRTLNRMKLHKLLRDKLTERYQTIATKVNTQTYFVVDETAS